MVSIAWYGTIAAPAYVLAYSLLSKGIKAFLTQSENICAEICNVVIYDDNKHLELSTPAILYPWEYQDAICFLSLVRLTGLFEKGILTERAFIENSATVSF